MYKYIITTFFLPILFSSCSQSSTSIEIASESSADSIAMLCKEYLMEGEYYYFPDDSLLVPAINYYENCLFSQHESLVYLYFSRGKRDLRRNKYESTALNFLEAEKHIHKAQVMPFFKGILYGDMAYLYHLQNELEASIENYQHAADIFKSINDSLSYAVMQTRLGFEYSSSQQFEKARMVFEETQPYLQFNPVEYGQLLHMIGVMYDYQDSLEQSCHYMYESLKYPDCALNIATRHNILARNLLKMNQLDSSISHAYKVVESSQSPLLNEASYQTLYQITLLRGDVVLAESLSDSVSKYNQINQKIRSQEKFQVIREKEYLIQTVKRQDKIMITLVCILILILLITLVSYLLFKRRINHFKTKTQKQQMVLTKQQEYVDDVQEKNKMYDLKQNNDFQMHKYHAFKASLYSYLEHKVPQYSKPGNFEKVRPIYESYLHLNDWDAFVILFDKELNGMVSKLIKNYFPSFTKRSQNLIYACCLIFLKVPDIDIALLLGYASINSFSTSKKRLKTRFHLESTKELHAFFEKVMLMDS